jgi:hypothetical protein
MRSDYLWRESYTAAILETDHENLPERLQAAQVAMDRRLHEMQAGHNGTLEERHAISDALPGLRVLRREIQRRCQKTGLSNM